jgi:hypothetical protein
VALPDTEAAVSKDVTFPTGVTLVHSSWLLQRILVTNYIVSVTYICKSFVGNIHKLVCNILIDGDDVSASDFVVSHCQPNPHVRTVNSFENVITGLFIGTLYNCNGPW